MTHAAQTDTVVPCPAHLRQAVDRLAGKRTLVKDLRSKIPAMRRVFEAEKDRTLNEIEDATREEQNTESALRTMALAYHRATGHIDVGPGVRVVVPVPGDGNPYVMIAEDLDAALGGAP